jgi:hypothetical protein
MVLYSLAVLPKPHASRGLAAVVVVVLAAGGTGLAQELEPRAYSPSPLGANFFGIVLGNSQGGVLFDPTVPITDAEASVNLTSLAYGRTFGLWGRQGLVTLAVPYAWGDVEGFVGEETEAQRVTRSGLADSRAKVSLNLIGSPALDRAAFRAAPRRTILGLSLTVQAPTGEYDNTKLINLGNNRWAFKPEVGVSVPAGRWFLDAYAGVWFFTTNDEFYPGEVTRRQDSITTVQAHVSYTFRSRAWIALNATWYGGGSATSDDGPPSERLSNSRYGATLAIPITASQSLKIGASTGASTRVGSDFDSVAVAWQMLWFDQVPKPQP